MVLKLPNKWMPKRKDQTKPAAERVTIRKWITKKFRNFFHKKEDSGTDSATDKLIKHQTPECTRTPLCPATNESPEQRVPEFGALDYSRDALVDWFNGRPNVDKYGWNKASLMKVKVVSKVNLTKTDDLSTSTCTHQSISPACDTINSDDNASSLDTSNSFHTLHSADIAISAPSVHSFNGDKNDSYLTDTLDDQKLSPQAINVHRYYNMCQQEQETAEMAFKHIGEYEDNNLCQQEQEQAEMALKHIGEYEKRSLVQVGEHQNLMDFSVMEKETLVDYEISFYDEKLVDYETSFYEEILVDYEKSFYEESSLD